MLLKILIVIAIVLVVFILVVMLQPAEFRVSRSTSIAAPPETLFAQVNTAPQLGRMEPVG